MNKPLAEIFVFVLQQIITHAPGLIADLKALFQKEDVTVADLQALRDRIAAESYEGQVPHSRLGGTGDGGEG
jgi:hypothetical protein